ncbi:LLM class flavin-dependent oxidoreductase [Phytoactinopolyspora alkaliphila]|uniref:LLM class flavin-dependent oxidoreductase n=1 Tax=Phytoactinopolyspora alkaliphila TaxID=1783498 RepID=A0A6N9YII2_9ACTN|nr:LLM class flavin-dependent oxidoreductase [Phytoactinopolyspora alkaliphila]NED94745.1 LLM class flavin-dependent oxidoreductase [Phytoactinopolyspora alkaliphila]
MRLALAVSGKRTARDAVHVAQLAEEHGLDEVWLTEDYVERGAFAVAGAVLAATRTVTVGIGVVNPWTRHPVLTAMEAGALQELAPGRVVLGLGASNARWMEHQLGIPFVRPLTRLRDSVRMVRSALDEGVVDHDGEYGRVRADMSFRPPGSVPVVLGVKGPRALELAGEVADGVLLSVLSSPAYVSWALDRIGTTLPRGVASYVAVSYDPDRAVARDRIRPFAATFLGIHGDHSITRVAGLDPLQAAALRDGWHAGAPRVDLVNDDVLDTFTVAGDRDDLATGLHRLVNAGLDVAVVHDQMEPDLPALLDAVRAAVRLR